jgi:hypothetical protein
MGALGDKHCAVQTVGLDSAIFIRKVTEIEIIVLERWLQEQTLSRPDTET